MEYIFFNTRAVPPWRAKIRGALQKLFGQKTEIVRITDSLTQTNVQDGAIPSLDFDSLLQMLCTNMLSTQRDKYFSILKHGTIILINIW